MWQLSISQRGQVSLFWLSWGLTSHMASANFAVADTSLSFWEKEVAPNEQNSCPESGPEYWHEERGCLYILRVLSMPSLTPNLKTLPVIACCSHSRVSSTVSVLLGEVKGKVTTLLAGRKLHSGHLHVPPSVMLSVLHDWSLTDKRAWSCCCKSFSITHYEVRRCIGIRGEKKEWSFRSL